MLRQAEAKDGEEDQLYGAEYRGDELPEALRDRPWGKKIELVYQGKPQEGPRDPAQGILTINENAKGAKTSK